MNNTQCKCQAKWIDEQGKPTPDNNDAVMMAHFHAPEWSLPAGGIGNRITGYSKTIQESFPICERHYARVQYSWRFENGGAWSFSPVEVK